MNRGQRLIQAYRQAPWRRQVQWIGLFLAAVIFVAVVAGVYLSVTARAAAYGRNIQDVRADMDILEKEIEDLETDLASLTSVEVMEERARDLEYLPIQKNQMIHLTVSGYGGRPLADQSVVAPESPQENNTLPPEFTLSLIEWFQMTVREWAVKYGTPVEGLVQ
jgi:cell division protein FtsB